MKINEFFDKGYYINLDRRQDRNTEFLSELKNVGLDTFFTRINGVDSARFPCIDYKHYFCALSHMKIYIDAFINSYNRILILEDDFMFYNTPEYKGLDIIEKSLDQLQMIKDWDILFLGGYVGDEKVHQISPNLLNINKILTNHGIGVSSKAIKKLFEYKPFEDSALDGWISDREYLNKFIVYPLSSIQRESPSDLDITGKTPDVKHFVTKYLSPTVEIIKYD